MSNVQRLTKRQKRILKQENVLDKRGNIVGSNFKAADITPLTEAQEDTFDSYSEGYNLVLYGCAGTGKTFLALYLSIRDVLNAHYNKIYIIRSVVPTRDMGFLPGNQKEKTRVYESPYYDIYTRIFQRGDAYDILKTKNLVEFMSTSFIRGITLDDCIIVVDEAQNMSAMELHSIMTRVGKNCKILFCGDTAQDDLTSERKKEQSGFRDFLKILMKVKEFDFVEFQVEDIVRSGLVRSYIIARNKIGM